MAMLNLVVVTPERQLFASKVDSVRLPTDMGQIGILPHHTELITTISEGELIARQKDEVYRFALHGGFAQIMGDEVIVLADSAERVEDIDMERAELALERAVEALQKGDLSADERERYERRLHRAETRLRLARRRQRSGPPKYA